MKDYFIYTTHCEYIIASNDLIPDSITKELNINPTRTYKKGDKSISEASGTIITKQCGLWAISSEATKFKNNENIIHHINYLNAIIFPKIDILKRIKKDNNFETTFWVWVETDNAGIGIEIDDKSLDFINAISNKLRFSLITK